MTLNNLAALYAAQGKRKKAAQLYDQALHIFVKTLPAKHPKLVQCRKNYQRLLALPPLVR